ncbi:TonB-dependent receptor plug domain-containing protein [Salegentibacter chungangensis]|uniref:TonB-dependent receptor plug domain-containing protein n=1 Tax=Salegentibacter chungangensis TaxID=1335724 RepID=A0ABW3NSU6_9FLAO
MKNIRFYIFFIGLLCSTPVFSQNDSITRLEEVVLSDVKLYQNTRGQEVSVLSDSLLTENEPFLTSVLKFNSPVYIRENGYGMVASPSFRGTTASQTAVVWNGININSQFNGQTDFNTINTSGYDNVAVRAGGGSVIYGSGAIGGSIHLNNRFEFGKGLRNKLRLNYGSFNTLSGDLSSGFSSEKFSVYAGLSGVTSDNDYKYPGTEKYNENGDFHNLGFRGGSAYWLDKNNVLKFHTMYYEGERAFSGTLTAPSNSKYQDVNNRNLLEWKGFFNKFTSDLKLAYLDEHYKYYENRDSENFEFGDAKTFISRYDLNYNAGNGIQLNVILDYRNTLGKGSNFDKRERNTGALAFLYSQDLDRFSYEASLRKELSDRYESPLLFALSGGYDLTSFYNIKFSISKNYRIPAYNDLFWAGSGNPDLRPETSWQGELGQKFHFDNAEFGAIVYLMKIDDLLRWVPNNSGLWRPQNTESVTNYGLELRGNLDKDFGQHHFSLNSTYAYTRTRDDKLGKELIYTPKHKATASLGYALKHFSTFFQFLYNGPIYTSTDNAYKLDGYSISNLGVAYAFGVKKKLKLGLELRNLFDKKYQSLPSRPMPGRSINSSLTFKF